MGRQEQVEELREHLGEERRKREMPKRQKRMVGRKIGQGQGQRQRGTEGEAKKKAADAPAQIAAAVVAAVAVAAVAAAEYFESRLFPCALLWLRVPFAGEPYCVRKVWAQG